MTVYVVVMEGIVDLSDDMLKVAGVYKTEQEAKQKVEEILEQDKKDNPDWYEDEDFIFERHKDGFEVYQDGRYCENHFNVRIKTAEL